MRSRLADDTTRNIPGKTVTYFNRPTRHIVYINWYNKQALTRRTQSHFPLLLHLAAAVLVGFGVWGVGFGVWGLGFGVDVWGLDTPATCCAVDVPGGRLEGSAAVQVLGFRV